MSIFRFLSLFVVVPLFPLFCGFALTLYIMNKKTITIEIEKLPSGDFTMRVVDAFGGAFADGDIDTLLQVLTVVFYDNLSDGLQE